MQQKKEHYILPLMTHPFKEEYIKGIFRSLRTKIVLAFHDIADKSLVLSSLDARVGKSTIASNTAIAIAYQGMKTVLIDGDLRRGTLHKFFDIDQKPGLCDLICSNVSITDETVSSVVQPTMIPNLYVVPSEQNIIESSEVLTSTRFRQFKKILSNQFEWIILDTPPIGALVDAIVVGDIFSRYVLIVKAGVTNVIDMKKKINEYPQLKQKILGLILNYSALDKKLKYYKYSKYYNY